MNSRLRLGYVFGVQVFVDWSWIVTSVLAAATLVSLNGRLLSAGEGALASSRFAEGALTAVAVTAGLFASLGAHELARVLAARRAGVPVRRLTLFVLGGVSDVERTPATPRTELLGAITAPAVSLAVAVALGLGVAITSAPLPRAAGDFDRMGLHGLVLAEIAAANLAIAAVNLLPAYPLDGGRVVRALVWRVTRDVDLATRWAAWAGQLVGWALVLGGVAAALSAAVTPALGGWSVGLGWFLTSAAAQGYAHVKEEGRAAARSAA